MLAQALPPFVESVQMVDARAGYAVGGRQTDRLPQLYRTADGGVRWTVVTGAATPAAPPTVVGSRTVYFPTLRRGAIVVERSEDGGRTWRGSQPIRDRHPLGPGSVQVLAAGRLALVVGEGAAAGSSAQSLWTSADEGRTWRFVSRTSTTGEKGALPFSCDKTGIGFATPLRGFAAGACAGGRAFLYRTDDGGRAWRPIVLSGLSRCACDVDPPRFFGARTGAFAVNGFPQSGAGAPVARVYWTSDGGSRWRLTLPPLGRLGSASFPAAGVAWVPGTAHGSIRLPFDRLARTTDAGRHWTVVRLPFDAQNAQLDVLGATRAFALVAQHRLLRTTDGGRSWQTVG